MKSCQNCSCEPGCPHVGYGNLAICASWTEIDEPEPSAYEKEKEAEEAEVDEQMRVEKERKEADDE